MKKALIVVGLLYGDEGKGNIVDYIVYREKATAVVKFNGGPQAAHNVHTPDGLHHTFSQFGSGTFLGAKTYLSRYVTIDPFALYQEANAIRKKTNREPYNLIGVDMKCNIITPYHKAYNRAIEEKRAENRHGSCGVGYGISVEMVLCGAPILSVSDMDSIPKMLLALKQIKEYLLKKAKEDELLDTIFDKIFDDEFISSFYNEIFYCINPFYDLNKELYNHSTVVFEGAQGALLHENKGFSPNVTWSDTTNSNALNIIKNYELQTTNNKIVHTETIGVMRTYSTRHGAGKFDTEDSDFDCYAVTDDNFTNDWQGSFRTGGIDLKALKYALSFSNVNYIALTHCDVIKRNINTIEEVLNKPIKIKSYGKTRTHKLEL